MRFLSFVSFASIFVAASGGLLLALTVLNTPNPWEIDFKGNKQLLRIPDENSEPITNYIQDIAKENPELLSEWITVHYRFSAMCLLATSTLLMLISFLAGRDRVLMLCVHICNLSWLLIFAHIMRPYATQDSQHYRFFVSILITSSFGLICYIIYLITRHNKYKKARQRHQSEQNQDHKDKTAINNNDNDNDKNEQ